jgi:hypothetical protein
MSIHVIDAVQKSDGTWNVYTDGKLLAVGLTLAQVDEISGTKQFKLYDPHERG